MTGLSVLVVEDERDTRRWLVECVAQAFPGATTSEAGTLAQARHALKTAQVRARAHGNGAMFDIALVDIGLPDGSGIDLVSQIATDVPGCAPIVTTIYDDPQQIYDAIAAGASGYLLKYHETERLVRLLRRILDDEPPLSPAVAREVMKSLKTFNPRIVPDETVLTGREEEVLALLGRGFQLGAVSEALSISRNTASTHVKAIYRKLNIKSRAQAALAARDRGLLGKDD